MVRNRPPGTADPDPRREVVIEANQDGDELPVCENELSLVIGVAGHDFNVLEGKAR